MRDVGGAWGPEEAHRRRAGRGFDTPLTHATQTHRARMSIVHSATYLHNLSPILLIMNCAQANRKTKKAKENVYCVLRNCRKGLGT